MPAWGRCGLRRRLRLRCDFSSVEQHQQMAKTEHVVVVVVIDSIDCCTVWQYACKSICNLISMPYVTPEQRLQTSKSTHRWVCTSFKCAISHVFFIAMRYMFFANKHAKSTMMYTIFATHYIIICMHIIIKDKFQFICHINHFSKWKGSNSICTLNISRSILYKYNNPTWPTFPPHPPFLEYIVLRNCFLNSSYNYIVS